MTQLTYRPREAGAIRALIKRGLVAHDRTIVT